MFERSFRRNFEFMYVDFQKRTFSCSNSFRQGRAAALLTVESLSIMLVDWDRDVHASLYITVRPGLEPLRTCGNTQVQERTWNAGSKTSMVKGMHHWSILIHGLNWAGPVEDSGVGMLWNDASSYRARDWVSGRGRRCYSSFNIVEW